jgi:hypothetical protein
VARLVPRPDVAVLDHLPEGALRVTDLRVVVGGEEDAAEAAAIDLLKARAGAAGATAIVITSRADTNQDVGTFWPFVRTARYHEFTAIGFRQ